MRIETYYDLGCDSCGSHRSTDFSKGMPYLKSDIIKMAPKEGWRYSRRKNVNYCPNCVKKAYDKAANIVFIGYCRGDIEDGCHERGIGIVSNRSTMERKLIDAMTMEFLESETI
ncbi:MAG: hypothetical protein AB7D36_09000 [Oscillospiraceae bacterium]